MRKVPLIAALALVGACVGACTDGGASRRAYLTSLVGQPEAEMVRLFGVPVRTYEAGGKRFAAYDDRRIDIVPGPFFGFGFGYWSGGFYSDPIPAAVVERGCETTFEIDRGVIAGWSLRGTWCR